MHCTQSIHSGHICSTHVHSKSPVHPNQLVSPAATINSQYWSQATVTFELVKTHSGLTKAQRPQFQVHYLMTERTSGFSSGWKKHVHSIYIFNSSNSSVGMEDWCGTCAVTFQRSSVTNRSEGISSEKSDGSCTHLHSCHSVFVLTGGDEIEKLTGTVLLQGAAYTRWACANGEWEENSWWTTPHLPSI